MHKLVVLFVTICLVCAQQDDDDEDTQKKRAVYDDPDKYVNLQNWLRDGKATFPKVEVEVRSEGYRALRAKQFIPRGEWVIFVPRTHFLTLEEVKKACLVNRKMIQVNHQPMNHQTYFVNHLLQESRRKNSVWRCYIDVLPTDVSGFPTYFGDEELALLKGSSTLQTVMEQRQQFRQEYDMMKEKIPEFSRYKYTFDDFLKLRILTNSRTYTVNLNNEYVQILVPLADFINHHNDGNLEFDYSPQQDGFFMQASRDIRRGEELFHNYGKLSNKFFFMNYGFALDYISMNQYDFHMCIAADQPLTRLKVQLNNGNNCSFNRLVNETDHGTFRETISVARFLSIERLDEYFQFEKTVLGYQQFSPGQHSKPVSTALEKRMWIWFKAFLMNQMAEFASTIEEDYRNMKNPNLADFRKQIIIITLKEKQIIRENIEVCNQALELIDLPHADLAGRLRYSKYNKVQGYIKQELIPMKQELNE